MMQVFSLLLKLWPIIKPILPVILKLIEANKGLIQANIARPETTSAEDVQDFFKELEARDRWEPFKKEWED